MKWDKSTELSWVFWNCQHLLFTYVSYYKYGFSYAVEQKNFITITALPLNNFDLIKWSNHLKEWKTTKLIFSWPTGIKSQLNFLFSIHCWINIHYLLSVWRIDVPKYCIVNFLLFVAIFLVSSHAGLLHRYYWRYLWRGAEFQGEEGIASLILPGFAQMVLQSWMIHCNKDSECSS